jgi:hypothetical protein
MQLGHSPSMPIPEVGSAGRKNKGSSLRPRYAITTRTALTFAFFTIHRLAHSRVRASRAMDHVLRTFSYRANTGVMSFRRKQLRKTSGGPAGRVHCGYLQAANLRFEGAVSNRGKVLQARYVASAWILRRCLAFSQQRRLSHVTIHNVSLRDTGCLEY